MLSMHAAFSAAEGGAAINFGGEVGAVWCVWLALLPVVPLDGLTPS